MFLGARFWVPLESQGLHNTLLVAHFLGPNPAWRIVAHVTTVGLALRAWVAAETTQTLRSALHLSAKHTIAPGK